MCFRSTLFLPPLTTQDFARFFPLSQGQGHVLMLILLQWTPVVSQTCLTFQFPQTLVSRKIFHDLSRHFHLWLLISPHASTPALFNLFLTYMLVFPSLVFIIFKDFVCLYLLHFAWRSYLRDYEDYAVYDFLEFGWPVGFDYSSSFPKTPDFCHHKGVIDFPDAVDSYLLSETVRNAVTGPFSHNPFPCPVAVSPLNSVPMSDTGH